jgi:hypothetical protein
MKTESEIEKAKMVLAVIIQDGVNYDQRCVINGMLVALCWVTGSGNGSTLRRLLDGEPVQTQLSRTELH